MTFDIKATAQALVRPDAHALAHASRRHQASHGIMTTAGFMGQRSPDRLDAMVWALSELSGTGKTIEIVGVLGRELINLPVCSSLDRGRVWQAGAMSGWAKSATATKPGRGGARSGERATDQPHRTGHQGPWLQRYCPKEQCRVHLQSLG